jgi:hypothetical protein
VNEKGIYTSERVCGHMLVIHGFEITSIIQNPKSIETHHTLTVDSLLISQVDNLPSAQPRPRQSFLNTLSFPPFISSVISLPKLLPRLPTRLIQHHALKRSHFPPPPPSHPRPLGDIRQQPWLWLRLGRPTLRPSSGI